jgi:hypothetical protein
MRHRLEEWARGARAVADLVVSRSWDGLADRGLMDVELTPEAREGLEREVGTYPAEFARVPDDAIQDAIASRMEEEGEDDDDGLCLFYTIDLPMFDSDGRTDLEVVLRIYETDTWSW